MEHPTALREGGGTYRWHAGAPDDESFARAHDELLGRIRGRLPDLRLESVSPLEETVSLEAEPESGAATGRVSDEYVAVAYGDELLELVATAPKSWCSTRTSPPTAASVRSSSSYPPRFIEVGIAEQDMVSMAAGLARHGLVPVVNSFASFLAARANEQIYNQASEGTKVVYALHYAGLIPAGPGKSHQSIRDVSLLAALPNVDDRAARERGGNPRPPALGGRRRGRERCDPACDRSFAAAARRSRRGVGRPRNRAHETATALRSLPTAR